jgi:hypothetical protein
MLKRNLSVVLVISVLLINCAFVSAITGSMGNAKMILYPEVNGWTTKTIDKTILVKNVNDVAINIKLQIDIEGEKFLELLDEEFVLEPGEEKKAGFLVKVRKEGRYDGKINVFFSPIEEGAGVVLSSSVIVIAAKDQDYDEFEEEGEVDEDDGEIAPITGNVVDGEKKNTGLIFLGISSLVLLVILVILMGVVSGKNKSAEVNESSTEKKKGRSSAYPKLKNKGAKKK